MAYGMERPETAALGNLTRMYSAQARSVPSVRLLGGHSIWLTQRRALGNDTDWGYTRPPSRQSEWRVPRSFECSVPDGIQGQRLCGEQDQVTLEGDATEQCPRRI